MRSFWDWCCLWWDNRFPRKAKPMIGFFSQLTSEQRARILRGMNHKEDV